jgi:tetratricopeptide (TPR) repeat protein
LAIFDFLDGEKRNARKRKNAVVEKGAMAFVVLKQVQELSAKAESLEKLGRSGEAKDKLDEALHVAKRAMEKYPESAEFHYVVCNVHLNRSEYTLAETCLKHLIANHYKKGGTAIVEAYAALGLLKWNFQHNAVSASKYLQRALSSVTQDTPPDVATKAHAYLAQLCLDQGDYERAERHVTMRLNAVPDCPIAKAIDDVIKYSEDQMYDENVIPEEWTLIADNVVFPVLLEGHNNALTVDSEDEYIEFATTLMLAKSSGWRGGVDFFVYHDRKGYLRRLESGMTISDDEAMALAQLIQTHREDWRDNGWVRSFVALCKAGAWRVAV